MNLKRIWTLVKTEVFHGPKDLVLVIAVVMPILLAFFFNLAFGNIFSDRPRLGIYDEGHSGLPAALASPESISLKIFNSEAALRGAAADGSIDMGIALPSDFDSTLSSGSVRLKAYVWGESLAKNRALIPVVLADAVRQLSGTELPVNIETVALGDESAVPWSDRVLPLTVLIAVFYGGMMIPASRRPLSAKYSPPKGSSAPSWQSLWVC
jgi:ABC-2 type transport system permease protein